MTAPFPLITLPTTCGVYRFLDAQNRIIYVGKARNIRKRVASYFKENHPSVKTQTLRQHIAYIETTVTTDESQALLLESNMIKRYKPKYNIVLRDDKTYPYIHIDRNHVFPRIEKYRAKKKPQGSDFFGPYPNIGAVRDMMTLIQTLFKIRPCTNAYFRSRTRPCLQYQIQRCTAPCVGYIDTPTYAEYVEDAVLFLQGKSETVRIHLKKQLDEAVARLDFEKAAHIRDALQHIHMVHANIATMQGAEDIDILTMTLEPCPCIYYIAIREGAMVRSEAFFPVVPEYVSLAPEDMGGIWTAMIHSFISWYTEQDPSWLPDIVILDKPIDDKTLVEKALSGYKGSGVRCVYRYPDIKRWFELAYHNREAAIQLHMKEHYLYADAYRLLASYLNLPVIRNMVCFDISHTQGIATMASCVRFDLHGPAPSLYRRFPIQGIEKGDDYAALRQALTKCIPSWEEQENMPDLIVIDGGKGQIQVGLDVFAHRRDVQIIGMVKGLGRKAEYDRVMYYKDGWKTLPLAPQDGVLHMLQHIRDEAHRYAITAHRRKRNALGLQSALDAIPGVGPKKKKALLTHFGGLQGIKAASPEALAQVPGISKALAEAIAAFWHM